MREIPDDPLTQLHLIVEHTPDLIVSLDRDCRIRFINYTLPQFSVSQVLGTSALDYVQECDRDRYRLTFDEVLESGEPRALEIAAGGAWWLSRFVPVSRRPGGVESVLVIATDITERKRSEERIRESEALFRSLAESTSAAIFIIQDAKILYANRAAELLTGYSADEIGELSFGDLLRPCHRGGPERAPSLPQAPARCELRLVTRTGEERLVDYSASTFEHGGRPAIVGTAIDITDRDRAERERQRLEAQVQQAQRLESLGVLAGGMAHDFNNLLTGILGSASLLALKFPDGSLEAKQVQRVLAAAESAAELTRKMLAFAGRTPFVLQPADLNQVVEDVLPLVRTSLGEGIEIRPELAPNLPRIEADREQLQQVLVNLLTNSAEAQASRIVIRTGVRAGIPDGEESGPARPSSCVFLEVRDDGSGMDETTKSRAFDPFFSTKFTGRGLGLAAVQGIVSAHRGTIALDTACGRGAAFTLVFPALTPERSGDGADGEEL